ncbi:MAG TPA: succinate dehydrogenase, hydrophobic membrane anchor protein [Stellaceae bacterium]|nr:succinate dehydrogenase, hydrophobic membrane anchor protein [Stellaceae bacterium]
MSGSSEMRTPLKRVYGLGSAREGAHEWWSMRLTSVALIPLTLWFVIGVIGHAGADYESFTTWVASPVVSILLILTLAVTFHHVATGVKVVIEDYIHVEWVKIVCLVALKFGCLILAVAGIFSVLRIAFGG